MKYGIVTFHNIPNFGAMLQAYALCIQLRRLGQECEIINYECDNIVKREFTFHRSANPVKSMMRYFLIWPRNKKKIRECSKFMRECNLYSGMKYKNMNIKHATEQYDGFISGSDEIWNLDKTDHDWTYFLDFVPDTKPKYAFSPSVNGRWDEKDVEKIRILLSRYSMLSVRENEICSFIKETMGMDCLQMPDPTFFLTADEWRSFIKRPKINDYVLVYFPEPEILKAAKEYARKNKKAVVVVNNGMPIGGVKNVPLYEPGSWLGYIDNAEAVFTDSFHGVLFSLYFQKKVWTSNQRNKIESLLKQMDLEQCFIENDREYRNRINFRVCNEKIAESRERGISYLAKLL